MITTALALLLAQAPPDRSWHARYGPLTQCLGGYAVNVASDEAVQTGEGTIILTGPTRWLRLMLDSENLYAGFSHGDEIDSPELGHIRRVGLPYRARSLLDSNYVFLLPPAGGGPALRVDSAAFNSGAPDLAVLAPIRTRQSGQACGDFHAPAWPGDDPQAASWQRETKSGPFYHCRNGIGFAVRAGEIARLSWPGLELEPALQVRVGPIALAVRGPVEAPAGSGRVASAFPEALETGTDGPNLVLAPPHMAGQPRTRAQMDAAARAYWRTIRIGYPQGQEAAARAFANRLEFVESTDPRCHGDPTAS